MEEDLHRRLRLGVALQHLQDQVRHLSNGRQTGPPLTSHRVWGGGHTQSRGGGGGAIFFGTSLANEKWHLPPNRWFFCCQQMATSLLAIPGTQSSGHWEEGHLSMINGVLYRFVLALPPAKVWGIFRNC